jgi:N-acetylneuraminic acid mutarotase
LTRKNKFPIAFALIFIFFILGFTDFHCTFFVSALTKYPAARFGHDMVYDSKNNQTILFGGDNSGFTLDNLKTTWIYSSFSQTWIEISDSSSPCARINHQMVYSSISDKVILFGGMETSGHTKLDDTWEFDPITNEWTELHPTVSPSARHSQAMYFDPVLNVVVLFGGYLENDQLSSETWIYNCTADIWNQIYPVTHPTTRYGHVFRYDGEQHIGFFFGGRHVGLMDETWFFNLSSITWTQKTPVIKPIRRYWFDMVYNTFAKNFILFGGDNEETSLRALDDTWIFSSSVAMWTNIEPTINPPPRNNHAMVFDTYLNKTLLFGGYGENYKEIYGDLWMFDSTDMNWNQISATKSNTWRIILLYIMGPVVLIGIISVVVIFLRKNKIRKMAQLN